MTSTVSPAKTAIVTGSTSGIGLGIARGFAAAGYNVVLNGFGDGAEIEKLHSDLDHASAGKVIYHGADMTDPAQIEDLVRTAETAFGGVDVLVNNAGIQFVSPVETFPADKWERIVQINLSAAFYATRATIPAMKLRGAGRIINLASAHALVASPFKSAYVAAKHGIAGFTKSVALEVATAGITVNAICPGYVLTPLVEAQIPDTARARGISEEDVVKNVILAAQPTKRFVTVEEIAALALFLSGDLAGSITGAIIPIDGGWTAA